MMRHSLLAFTLTNALTLGTGCPGPAPPRIVSFAADPAWGDAPLTSTLVWELDAPDGPTTCSLDIDGDGVAEQEIADCPARGRVPVRIEQRGRLAPVLRVSGPAGVVERRAEVYANYLELDPDRVVRPEALPGFVRAAVADTQLTLEFTGAAPAAIAPGALLWSTTGAGYLRRVVAVQPQGGGRLLVTTQKAPLTEAIRHAFVGAVGAPMVPTPAVVPGPIDMQAVTADGRVLRGTAQALRISGGDLSLSATLTLEDIVLKDDAGNTALRLPSLELRIEVGLNRIVIDIDWFTLREFTFAPYLKVSAKTSVSLRKIKLAHKKWALSDLTVGIFPLPIPVEAAAQPVLSGELHLDLDASAGVEIGVQGDALVEYRDEELSADGHFSAAPRWEPGPPLSWDIEGSLTAQVSLSPGIAFRLLGLAGPYIYPYGFVRAQGTLSGKDGLCFTASAGVEGEVGFRSRELFGLALEVSTSLGAEAAFQFYESCPFHGPGAESDGGAHPPDLGLAQPDQGLAPPDMSLGSRPDLTGPREDLSRRPQDLTASHDLTAPADLGACHATLNLVKFEHTGTNRCGDYAQAHLIASISGTAGEQKDLCICDGQYGGSWSCDCTRSVAGSGVLDVTATAHWKRAGDHKEHVWWLYTRCHTGGVSVTPEINCRAGYPCYESGGPFYWMDDSCTP